MKIRDLINRLMEFDQTMHIELTITSHLATDVYVLDNANFSIWENEDHIPVLDIGLCNLDRKKK